MDGSSNFINVYLIKKAFFTDKKLIMIILFVLLTKFHLFYSKAVILKFEILYNSNKIIRYNCHPKLKNGNIIDSRTLTKRRSSYYHLEKVKIL